MLPVAFVCLGADHRVEERARVRRPGTTAASATGVAAVVAAAAPLQAAAAATGAVVSAAATRVADPIGGVGPGTAVAVTEAVSTIAWQSLRAGRATTAANAATGSTITAAATTTGHHHQLAIDHDTASTTTTSSATASILACSSGAATIDISPATLAIRDGLVRAVRAVVSALPNRERHCLTRRHPHQPGYDRSLTSIPAAIGFAAIVSVPAGTTDRPNTQPVGRRWHDHLDHRSGVPIACGRIRYSWRSRHRASSRVMQTLRIIAICTGAQQRGGLSRQPTYQPRPAPTPLRRDPRPSPRTTIASP